jgi:hypothetical protein
MSTLLKALMFLIKCVHVVSEAHTHLHKHEGPAPTTLSDHKIARLSFTKETGPERSDSTTLTEYPLTTISKEALDQVVHNTSEENTHFPKQH